MQINFVPQNYEYYTGSDLLEKGDYPVVIETDIAERTKDQTGGLLKVTFVVMQGHPNAGRKLFNRFNLWNASEASAATAHKQYKTMLAAMGIYQPTANTEETYGKPLMVTVDNDGTYNNVRAFKTINGVVPGKEGQAGALQGGQPVQQGGPQFGAPQQPQQPQGGFTPQQQFGGSPQGGGFAPPQQQPYQQQPQQGGQPGWGAPPQGGGFAPPQQQPQYSQPQQQMPPNPATGFQQQPQQSAPGGWPTA